MSILWKRVFNKMRSKKAKLRSEADKLWFKKYLKLNCEVCGSSGGILQGHHFYYRSSYGHLRYSEDNHITLCKKCHFILHTQDPKLITDTIIMVRGKKWYNKLKQQAQNRPQGSYLTIQWYEQKLKELSDTLN